METTVDTELAMEDQSVTPEEEQGLLDLTGAGRSAERLSAAQLVERIMAINPSATPGFLSRFTPDRLANYLDHLLVMQSDRGSGSLAWVRRGETRAITMRVALD